MNSKRIKPARIAVPKQLGNIIDLAVLVEVDRQEAIVSCGPSRTFRKTVTIEVKVRRNT